MTKEAINALTQALAIEPYKALFEIGAKELAVKRAIEGGKIEGLSQQDKAAVQLAVEGSYLVTEVAAILGEYIKYRYGG